IADARPGEDNRYLFTIHRQRSGNFGPDKSAADDDEAILFICERAQASIVFGRAIINYFIATEWERPRFPAGREQELLVGVRCALIVCGSFTFKIERLHRTAEMERCVLLGRAAPDAFKRFVFPKTFRQRWAVIRWVGFHADEADGAVGVD